MLPVALVPVPVKGRGGFLALVTPRVPQAHGQARVAPGTAKPGTATRLLPRDTTACGDQLGFAPGGTQGCQRGEEPSSTCSQLSWPFGHHFASQCPVQLAMLVLV